MKKSYLLVLALAAIISVSACSETSSSLSPSSEEPSETTSQVEPSQEPSSVDPTSEEQPSSEEPSSVNPSSEQPSSEEPSISVAQDYAINVDAPNTVTIEVAEQATEGSTDTFTVTVNYPRKTELVSVKVNDFTLQPDGNSYSFTMPEENIFVELQLDVTPYKLSLEVTGVQTIIDYNIYDIENDEVRITKDSYVKAGTQLKAEFMMTSTTNSKKYKVEKVYFDGQPLTLNEDGFFYVTMPSYPTSFSVETVKINRNFTINKTENLSAYITEKETDTIDQNVSYGLFDTTYYVHTSSINDDFGVNGVEVSYVDENGDTQLVTVTQKTRGELYTFKCPAGDVTITVQEKDVSAYKNHEILGTYIGFQYYSYYANRTSPSSTHTITFSSNETTTSSLSARKDGYWRIIDSNQVELQKGTNNFLYTHEKDALVSPYKATNNGGNNESVYLYVRGESGSKITFDGCLSTENDTINWVVSVSLNDTYATTFACINNVLHLNVQVKMLEGTTINGASKFEVSKNDKLIATITNAGSNKLTVVEEKEAIIYTGEKGELSLKNDIALFEEENYSYIIDGNQITLSSSTKEYVLQLDNENLTYTVISFNQKDANPFSGYQFTGYYDDYSYTDEYGNPSQSSLKVTFNEGDTISGKLCAGSDSHWFDFDATLVGTELTLKITNACKTSYIGTSIKATVKNNTITFNQDIDDIYTIAYGVVSCQAFPGL